MAFEIERKFLVKGDAWRGLAESVRIRQEYVATKDGTTVFDPSATGDEAECQRKEIDRLERELLLRGIVMCPRGPILERVRPWTGVLESLERFQSARRDHYKRLVEVMQGTGNNKDKKVERREGGKP